MPIPTFARLHYEVYRGASCSIVLQTIVKHVSLFCDEAFKNLELAISSKS